MWVYSAWRHFIDFYILMTLLYGRRTHINCEILRKSHKYLYREMLMNSLLDAHWVAIQFMFKPILQCIFWWAFSMVELFRVMYFLILWLRIKWKQFVEVMFTHKKIIFCIILNRFYCSATLCQVCHAISHCFKCLALTGDLLKVL